MDSVQWMTGFVAKFFPENHQDLRANMFRPTSICQCKTTLGHLLSKDSGCGEFMFTFLLQLLLNVGNQANKISNAIALPLGNVQCYTSDGKIWYYDSWSVHAGISTRQELDQQFCAIN